MATDQDYVNYVIEQIQGAGEITAKKMFGEYAVYSNGKVFGFVCDNKLFIKPTAAGRSYAPDIAEGQPYPGAKNYLLVQEELEDVRWLAGLVKATLKELPEPKPKKGK